MFYFSLHWQVCGTVTCVRIKQRLKLIFNVTVDQFVDSFSLSNATFVAVVVCGVSDEKNCFTLDVFYF